VRQSYGKRSAVPKKAEDRWEGKEVAVLPEGSRISLLFEKGPAVRTKSVRTRKWALWDFESKSRLQWIRQCVRKAESEDSVRYGKGTLLIGSNYRIETRETGKAESSVGMKGRLQKKKGGSAGGHRGWGFLFCGMSCKGKGFYPPKGGEPTAEGRKGGAMPIKSTNRKHDHNSLSVKPRKRGDLLRRRGKERDWFLGKSHEYL